jgi:hypothetical protein
LELITFYKVLYVHTLSKNKKTEQLPPCFREENITKFYFWELQSSSMRFFAQNGRREIEQKYKVEIWEPPVRSVKLNMCSTVK